MKTRCPACGAENSLDSLITSDDARQTLWTLAQIGGELTKRLVQYLGLFRPEKSSLSGARMAKLMSDLLPDIQAQRIQRGGKVFDVPVAAWVWALGEVLTARDTGTLKVPLKTHGYLYEILCHWRHDSSQLVDGVVTEKRPSSLSKSLQALEKMK